MQTGGVFPQSIILLTLLSKHIREGESKVEFPDPDRFIEKVIQHEIVVREGEDTRIPCDVLPGPHQSNFEKIGDRPTLIIWYRKDQNIPIYSLDLRKYSDSNPGLHWTNQNRTDRGRIHYEERGKVRMSHLFLPTVTREDGGKYRCRVDYMQYPTKNSWVKLKVIVGPTKPLLRDGKGSVIEDTILSKQGVSLTIFCQTKGIPLPSILWKLEGKPVQPVSYHTDQISGTVQSEVRISVKETVADKDGSLLECQASNSDRSSEPISTFTRLRTIAPPERVHLVRDQPYFKAGQRYNVTCLVTGVDVKPSVYISFNDYRLPIISIKELESGGDWRIAAEFHTSKDLDWETYNTNHVYNYFSDINMNDLKTFTDHVDDVMEGGSRGLTCRAASPLLPDLVLSDTWKPPIHYGPHVQLVLENQGKIQDGDDVYFVCQVSSFPPFQTIQWFRQNVDLEYKVEKNIFIEADRLYIRGVQREQEGTFMCRASNGITSQKSNPINLVVTDSRSLDITDCKISNQSSTSISIDCAWSGDSTANQFIFEVYKSESKELVANVSVDYPRLILSSLPPSTDFTVNLRSMRPSFYQITMETFTLRAEEPLATVTRISNPGYIRLLPLVGILLGILLVLSILPVTVHFLVRRRHLRGSQLQTDDVSDPDCMQLTSSLTRTEYNFASGSQSTELEYTCNPVFNSTSAQELEAAVQEVPHTFTSTFKQQQAGGSVQGSHVCSQAYPAVNTTVVHSTPAQVHLNFQEGARRPKLKSILKDREKSSLDVDGDSTLHRQNI